jgi:hypothetical protein
VIVSCLEGGWSLILDNNSILFYAPVRVGWTFVRQRNVFLVADGQTLRLHAVAATSSMSPTPNPSASAAGTRHRRLTVCLVEDEDDLRLLLTRTLGRAPGWECLAAYATAEAALEDIPRRKPDLV